MTEGLVKALHLLTAKERKRLAVIGGLIFMMALMEVVGIASILPFMAVLSEPEKIQTNKYLYTLYQYFSFQNVNSYLIFLGVMSFFILAGGNVVRVVATKAMFNFTYQQNHLLSYRLLERYLGRDYSFFLDRNSADLAKNIISESNQVVNGVYVPAMKAISRSVVVLLIVFFLLVIDPVLALLIGLTLGGAYTVLYVLIRKKISTQGILRVKMNADRFKAVNEALGGVKEIKVTGNELIYLKSYGRPSQVYSDVTAKNALLEYIPKFTMEVLAFGGIIVIMLFLLVTRGDVKDVIPMAALYAFAGYRLMPSLQEIFSSLTKIRFNRASLDILHADYFSSEPFNAVSKASVRALPFNKSIVLQQLDFSYAGSSALLFENFSLEIKVGEVLAVTGKTGCGKTTLIDILLGLLKPNSGSLLIDGVAVDDNNLKAWQMNVAYVPQQIYLIDDTIAANIAFGEAVVDMVRVRQVAAMAHIDEVIAALPQGYQTTAGDRGVKLSGGQRQRLGIARALYRNPRLLVLDEATSALDEETEAKIMDSIYAYSDHCTVLMIAHRLSTIEKASRVLKLDSL
jgi:ABC-type multidrug transport system fused ATPase/permease subunit